ncbi:FtsW/RodA/SpoVE family cell cycle protein [Cellulosilyticum ruminicola]|uniref:FtsW/RodA/SpoVE family cell cycle protein n=1 Tax=Cellulosilyticum ruminicola TaxID=425254 RepID=UPI0006D29C7D|nr:putative peptidoglycan glycosyltransferase FtsW [Cellulosilyticum ruminicola]
MGVEQSSNQVRKKKKANMATPDYIMMAVILLIFAFGVVMVYSASFYFCVNNGKAPANFALKQLGIGGVGVVVMLWLTYRFDYHIFSVPIINWAIYLGSITLSILVMFIGKEVNGAKRWIAIGPIQFQPSEVAKVAVIIMLASYIVRNRKNFNNIKYRLGAWGIFLIPAGIVMVENLSSAIVIGGIGFVMCFISMPKIKIYIVIVILGACAVFGAYSLAMSTPEGQDPANPILKVVLPAYRLERIQVWLDPWIDPKDSGYQPIQALYAVGSGGLFGKGLGNSVQKQSFLPEPYNDIIFAVICEELGLVGALVLISGYAILIIRGLSVAMRSIDYFGSLIATGISSMIAIQVIINMAVNTNTIPTTGMQLSLVSYGGTAVAVLLATLGILLNVSKSANIQKVKK